MKKSLRLIRYVIGGALFAIYAMGVVGPLLGFESPAYTAEAIAAVVGGGGAAALLLKAHIITF